MVLFVELIVWLIFVLLVVLAVCHLARQHYKLSRLIDRIPGPKGIPLFGVSLNFLTTRNNVTHVAQDIAQSYCEKYPLIRIWIGPFPIVFLLTAGVAKVLLSSSKQIKKALFYRYTHNWIGEGLLTSTGAKWQQRRKLITPSFHFRILENFLLVMNEQADILVQILHRKCSQMKGDELDIYPYVSRCTLDIICETAMGQSVNAQLNANSQYVNAVNNLTEVILRRMMRPWLAPDWIFNMSLSGWLERRSLKMVHDFTNQIIKTKREKLMQLKSANVDIGPEACDVGLKRRVALLDMLLENSVDDANGKSAPLTDDDIREEVDTFMFEGHDTTAVGISWALHCIGQHPDVQQKIVDELNSVFGENDVDATSAQLHNLKYLECVIKESMRLYPPVPLYGRTTTENINIGGYDIPSGVTLIVAPFWIHRDPNFYPDPEAFDPDRFLPDNSQARDPFAFIPFSAGLRNCIGQKFAVMEQKVVLSRILRRFGVSSDADPDPLSTFIPEVVLRPTNGVKVRLHVR